MSREHGDFDACQQRCKGSGCFLHGVIAVHAETSKRMERDDIPYDDAHLTFLRDVAASLRGACEKYATAAACYQQIDTLNIDNL